MGQTEVTRQSDEVLPPIVGSIVVVPLTAAVVIVDLTTMPQTAALPAQNLKGSENLNPLGQYLSMEPDAACFIAFAGTFAALASVASATTSTIAAGTGVITISNNCMIQLAAGQRIDFRMPPGPSQASSSSMVGSTATHGGLSSARFLGALATAGNTNLRIWVSSR